MEENKQEYVDTQERIDTFQNESWKKLSVLGNFRFDWLLQDFRKIPRTKKAEPFDLSEACRNTEYSVSANRSAYSLEV